MSATVSVVLVILVAVFTSVTAPLILAHRTERIRHRDRMDDYARQDEVAARAAKAATDLVESQKKIADAAEAARLQAMEAASLLAANNKLVAQTSTAISGQLGQIHTLVNSNMTAAMQSEYDAVGRELAMMQEVIGLRKAAGQEPTQQALTAVEATKTKLAELAANLEDRAKAQQRNDNDTAAAAAAAAAAEGAKGAR